MSSINDLAAASAVTIRANELRAGDVITAVGNTPRRGKESITVTEIRKLNFGGHLVKVIGFNGRDSEPRLMFRGIDAQVFVQVIR